MCYIIIPSAATCDSLGLLEGQLHTLNFRADISAHCFPVHTYLISLTFGAFLPLFWSPHPPQIKYLGRWVAKLNFFSNNSYFYTFGIGDTFLSAIFFLLF